MAAAREYFIHQPQLRVVICRKCKHAVYPDQIISHLRLSHRDLPLQDRLAIADDLRSWPDVLHSSDSFTLPRSVDQPVPGLRLFVDGLQCQLQPGQCYFIARRIDGMKAHWRTAHQWSAGARGRPSSRLQKEKCAQRQSEALRPVRCQRFFSHGSHAQYFEVLAPMVTPMEEEPLASAGGSLSTAVLQQLAVIEEQQTSRSQIIEVPQSTKEVSPWLELTRWPSYLRGHNFLDLAALVMLPDPELEPVLMTLCKSLERLVDDAYQSICSDCINVFDQARVNSFLERARAADRPLMIKLKKTTWRR